MNLPKIVLIDRDGVINFHSSDEGSPLYYILDHHNLILKPGVEKALEIIKSFGVPTHLVTKQRCIGKGLISKERVCIFHSRIERLTNFEFDNIYIEENEPNKSFLYKRILAENPNINPQNIWLFDDSQDERTIGARLGFTVFDGTNLLESVIKAFELK